MKKNIFLFVAGALFVVIVYMLLIKPKDSDLPTIFDRQPEIEIEKKADETIKKSREIILKSRERTKKNNDEIDKIVDDGLTDTEYDSLVRAIKTESRKADSIRNASGL